MKETNLIQLMFNKSSRYLQDMQQAELYNIRFQQSASTDEKEQPPLKHTKITQSPRSTVHKAYTLTSN